MAREYDFMLPEDRAQKAAEFEKKHLDGIATRSRGKTRFVLLHGIAREAVFVIGWNVLYAVYLHLMISLVARVTIFVLLMGRVFNLVEWHWSERRYSPQAKRNSPIERTGHI